MVFFPVRQSEIARSKHTLKKRGGVDDVSVKFLKLSEFHITSHLVKLLNKCIVNGIYPDEFKHTKITPAYKKKERNLISNYRPVAALTNLCKLFESIVFDRINSFFS